MTPVGVLMIASAAAGGGGPPPGGDPSFANVSSLLHLDGSNGSTTITDVKGLTWTAQAGAVISTAQGVFAQSVSCAATFNHDYIESQSHADFGFGTGDFTVEFWMRPQSFSTFAAHTIFDMYQGSGHGIQITLNGSSSPVTAMGAGFDGSNNITATVTIAVNTWYHVALTRTGTTWRLFLNGTQAGSNATNGVDLGSSGKIRVGRPQTGSAFTGIAAYFDELRITKGVARYTTTFTPDAVPFPDS